MIFLIFYTETLNNQIAGYFAIQITDKVKIVALIQTSLVTFKN